MWGDILDDYMQRDLDAHGFVAINLPVSERLTDDWTVDIEWVFRSSERHAVACVVTGIRHTGDGFRACPETIQEAAKATAEKLFKRYREHCEKE